MDKVYLVEEFGYEDHYLYDIYKNFEDAKKRLEEIYNEQEEHCKFLNNDKDYQRYTYFLKWNKDKTSFEKCCSDNNTALETFKINERNVL